MTGKDEVEFAFLGENPGVVGRLIYKFLFILKIIWKRGRIDD
jgi:hypothetical protein